MITVVWSDGQPASGIEYGVGDLECPSCAQRATHMIEARRGRERLGWMIVPCHCILDGAVYALDVTHDPVTVVFELKSQETPDTETKPAPRKRKARETKTS